MSRSNVRHSTGSPRWGTPQVVIEVAHAVLTRPNGGSDCVLPKTITVDPFSEDEFNAHVCASYFLDGDKGRDGFRDRWFRDERAPRADQLLAQLSGTVAPANNYTGLINPPNATDELEAGGATKSAWRILEGYHSLGWFGGGAIWAGFNLNQLQTLQLGSPIRSPLHESFMRCIPDRRLDFVRHSENLRMPTFQEALKIAKELGICSAMGREVTVARVLLMCDSSKDVERPERFRQVWLDVTADAPSHPMFFVLLPSTNSDVAVFQRQMFEELCHPLGEVW